MLKKLSIIASTLLICAAANARITSYGYPAEYGISEDPKNWYDINPHTWETFVSFDSEQMFGGDNTFTTLQVEYASMGVLEGRKVGDNTMVANFTDRRNLFGGDGYVDLYYFAPVNSCYAQQAAFLGGWKYNITKYVDLDLGGNIIYSTKKVIGPGIAGYGGESWRGDVYIGLVSGDCFLKPFVYFDYDPTYDAKKIQAGFSPVIELESLTAIKGLSLQNQLMLGYTDASRWSGKQKVGGRYWHNSYAFIQFESNLVYQINSWRIFAGIGFAAQNDGHGKVGQGGVDMGPDLMVWGTCGVGYIF